MLYVKFFKKNKLICPFCTLIIRESLWTTYPSSVNPQRASKYCHLHLILSRKRKREHLRRDQRPSAGWH